MLETAALSLSELRDRLDGQTNVHKAVAAGMELLHRLNRLDTQLTAANDFGAQQRLRADRFKDEVLALRAELDRERKRVRELQESLRLTQSSVAEFAKRDLENERQLEDTRSARCLQCGAHVSEVYQCTNGHVFPMHYLETGLNAEERLRARIAAMTDDQVVKLWRKLEAIGEEK